MPWVRELSGAETTATSHSVNSRVSESVPPAQASPQSGTRPEFVTAAPLHPKARNNCQALWPICPNPMNPTRASPSVGACGIFRSYTDVAQRLSRSARS